VIREPIHKPVKPSHLSEPTLLQKYTESTSEYAKVHSRNTTGFRSLPVSATQEADLEVGAGERRPDQPWVISRGEENRERERERERETDQLRKQRTRSSMNHLRRNKRQPLVDLRPDFRPIIGGLTLAKLRARC